MPRVIVLGAGGMLGQTVVNLARSLDVDVVSVGRTGDFSFRYPQDQVSTLFSRIGIRSSDFLVNCVGWIPQKQSGTDSVNRLNAQSLNVDLIRDLQAIKEEIDYGWVQILTDCVFSGRVGNYSENAEKDATDLYGTSKILGEQFTRSAMAIRASIIGPDKSSVAGLYSWFLSKAVKGGTIDGYQNVFWNGVSSLAFARLALNLASLGDTTAFHQHWVPSDSVSKHQLLGILASKGNFEDLNIQVSRAPAGVNRVLTTIDPVMNQKLWEIAGYRQIPTIEELCDEFISFDRRRE